MSHATDLFEELSEIVPGRKQEGGWKQSRSQSEQDEASFERQRRKSLGESGAYPLRKF